MEETDAAFDEALSRFASTGPEFGGGLSNHGPMAADALVALGRSDAVDSWAEKYARRLLEHPESRNPISPDEWREPLGDIARAGDWIAFFVRELDARPWREALDTLGGPSRSWHHGRRHAWHSPHGARRARARAEREPAATP